jgi:ASC-1-like (ASCH) protein
MQIVVKTVQQYDIIELMLSEKKFDNALAKAASLSLDS